MRIRGIVVFILALLCVILIASGGCSGKDEKIKQPLSQHTGNYTTNAKIRYKELDATAYISQETPMACSVTFNSPKSLNGMAFTFRNDSVDLNYKGLSFTYAPDTVPGGAIAKLAVAAINKAMKDDGLMMELDGGVLQISGIMESGEFFLNLDKDSGNLIKLSIPDEELEIEFDNFTFLD